MPVLALACRADAGLPQAEEVLCQATAHARASAAFEAPSYLYTKRTTVQNIDAADHVTNQKVQVKSVRSRPIGPADATHWSRTYGVNLDQELLDRYSLTLTKRIELAGRPTLEITFSPRNPPIPAHRPLDYLLNRAAGTLWVDEEDYEVAKADLRLLQAVNLSVLGEIDELTFRFERTRSADGGWLMTRTESTFRGRRLLNPIQTRHVTEYTAYKRLEPSHRDAHAAADTQVTAGG